MLMVAASFAQVCAQIDTIRGKVPFWHYNYYDSTWCQSYVNQGGLFIITPYNCIINKIGTMYVNQQGVFVGRPGYQICEYTRNDDMPSEVAIRMELDGVNEISGLVFGYNNTFYCATYDSIFYDYNHRFPFLPASYYYTTDFIFNIYDEWMNLIWSDTVATADLRVDYCMEAGFDEYYWEAAYRYWYSHNYSGGYEAPNYVNLCRVDFDTTIQVPETFYIGLTSTTPINILNDTMLMITAFFDYHIVNNYTDSIYRLPYETRRYRIAAQSVGEEILNWADEECHYGVQTCLYPILVLPCGEVTGLRCQAVGGAGTVALVEWDSGENNAAYEVSFGPRGTPPGEGTVTTVTVPRLVHSLDRNTHYDFYVRARCDLADTTWTAWSDPLHVHLATMSINGAEPVDWSLTPNPAHGSAAVWCNEGIKSVELLTVKGERIQYQDMAGERTCTLDLGGIAKGVYIVQVTTAQGTAARKLAVE